MPAAKEFCNRRVATARADETLHDVAARMRGEHVGSVVVVERRGAKLYPKLYPIGLLTDRDIVVAVLARKNRRIESVTVEDAMSPEPVTAHEKDDLGELVKRMQSAGVRRVPIVNDAGALVGIVAFDDLLGYVAEQLSGLAELVSREQAAEKHARPMAAVRPRPRVRAQLTGNGRSARAGRAAAGARRPSARSRRPYGS